MFTKTRQLLAGMSAPFRLSWLLLVAGMLLFIAGVLPLGWPTAWPGTGCLLLGLVIAGLSRRDREDPRSTDGAFRAAVFTSMLLTLTVLPLLLGAAIGFCVLLVGLFSGFDFSLFFVGVRMLLMALVYGFVTGIPAYATLHSPSHPTS